MGPARFMRQLNNIGDTKVGTLVGTDKFGNKYFENLNESYGTENASERPFFPLISGLELHRCNCQDQALGILQERSEFFCQMSSSDKRSTI